MKERKSALAPGTVVVGTRRHYRIVDVLGQGGFGITYLAECEIESAGTVTTISVALKEHFVESLCGRNEATRCVEYSAPVADEVKGSLNAFIKEAKRLRDLGVDHPNIVKIDEVFTANNTAYYAMEYLEGGTLERYVASRGRLSSDEMTKMLKPVIAAVATLHQNRIAHYDIKPANIMLRREWNGNLTAVLIDFGLAKHYDTRGRATSTLACAGYSAGYAPIEQYRGISDFSPACDVYALGATIYYCLTGRVPADAFDIQLDEVGRELLRVAGRETADVVIAALAEKAQNRLPDAGALYRQLFAGGERAATRPMPVEKSSGGGNPVLKTLIVIALIVVVCLAVGIFFDDRGASDDSGADTAVTTEAVEVDTVATVESVDPAPVHEVTPEEKAEFARRFKSNVTVGEWKAVGDPDENNAGDCAIRVKNGNGVSLDGSDYKLVFKFEYLYSDPPMHSETVTKKGVTIPAGGSVNFSHYYTDDCGPLEPRIKFVLTDEQIYDKYH